MTENLPRAARQRIGIRFALTICTVVAGCTSSDDGLHRVAVDGTVLVDSVPLSQGTLSLVPLGNGPACGAEVIDGKFQLTRQRGPVTGEYEARLTAGLTKATAPHDPAAGLTVKQFTTCRVTITDGGQPLALVFDSRE